MCYICVILLFQDRGQCALKQAIGPADCATLCPGACHRRPHLGWGMRTYAALIHVVACVAGAIALLEVRITGCFEPSFARPAVCLHSFVMPRSARQRNTLSVPPPHEDHCLPITTSSGGAVHADNHGCKGVGTASAQQHRSLLRLLCQPAPPPVASRRSHPHLVGSRGISVADTDIQPWNDRLDTWPSHRLAPNSAHNTTTSRPCCAARQGGMHAGCRGAHKHAASPLRGSAGPAWPVPSLCTVCPPSPPLPEFPLQPLIARPGAP